MSRRVGAKTVVRRGSSPAVLAALKRLQRALYYHGSAELYKVGSQLIVVTPGSDKPNGILVGLYTHGVFSNDVLDDIEAATRHRGPNCARRAPAAIRATLKRIQAAIWYHGTAEVYASDGSFRIVTPTGSTQPDGQLIGVYTRGAHAAHILDDIEAVL